MEISVIVTQGRGGLGATDTHKSNILKISILEASNSNRKI